MASRRPLIGITCNYAPHPEYPGRKDVCKQHVSYYQAIERTDGLPVLLPAVCDREKLADYLDRLDGILFSGASDIPPEVYGQAKHPKTETMSDQRFRFEWTLTELALSSALPILGICGGHQMLSTYSGGTLLQHIPEQVPGALEHYADGLEDPRHEVGVGRDSRLAEVFNARARVNSAHHQAIDQLGSGFVVVARSDDGIIEAIEHPGDRFLVGVQWHPERCQDLPGQEQLLAAFVSACREHQREK